MRQAGKEKTGDKLGHAPVLAAGLRLTRQRKALAELLFDGSHKHMTAEQVHDALVRRHEQVALATVYNALHQFTDAGLLRQITIDSSRVYFDTNIDAHHHFFDEESGRLTDIPASNVRIARLPKPPKGARLDRVDVILRVRPSGG